MRPFGPVPGTREMSIFSSFASFFAAGEASTRSPGALAGAAGAAAAAAGAGAAAPAAGAAPIRAETSSPASPITATGSRHLAVPPSATAIFSSVPEAEASMVFVSLSVSTSKRGSPSLTASPSFFSHLLTVPSVMVRPSLGITITLAIELPPVS